MTFHPNIRFASPRLPAPEGAVVVNVTSVSTDWGRKFSPMLPDEQQLEFAGLKSWTVENLWQFSKRYTEHVDDAPAWQRWRQAALDKKTGIRYPMGKLRKPEFAGLTPEDRFGPVEARYKIYIPVFMQKVDRFCQAELKRVREAAETAPIYLWDYDVYDPAGKTFDELAQAKASLGHGFLVGLAASQISSA